MAMNCVDSALLPRYARGVTRLAATLALMLALVALCTVASAQSSITNGPILNVTPFATDPSPCQAGQIWYNTTSSVYKVCPAGSASTVTSGGAGAVNSINGDGSLISNSGSTGAVTLTLGNAAAGSVWSNNAASASTPSYNQTLTLGAAGGTTGAITLNGTTSGSVILSAGASGGNLTINGTTNITGAVEVRNTDTLAWSSTSGASGTRDTTLCRSAAGVVEIGSSTGCAASGLLQQGGALRTTADFTTAANTNLQTITGLSLTVPAVALNYSFHCAGWYSQATGVAAVSFGIQAATNSPTNIMATGTVYTGATAVQDGVLATLATTTATAIVTGTPASIGVQTVWYLDGMIENPAAANTFNIMVKTATSADAVTVGRGSSCRFLITGS